MLKKEVDTTEQEASYHALKSDLEGNAAKLINSFKDNDTNLYPEELTDGIIKSLHRIKPFVKNPDNYIKWAMEKNEETLKINNVVKELSKEDQEKAIQILRESYDDIREVLKKYVDLKEEYYSIIPLWILGTYLHDKFESFPYLFFNAMRGSGKSKTLRLVCKLSKDGKVMASPTEAVLFRTTGTLGIDEFESVANKDKSAIRELINGAYKKGIKIMRMKKKKGLQGEEQVVEEFEPYRPIIMCNIWGMEEVLADRCISLILEKSSDPVKLRLTEDFDNDEIIQKVLKNLNQCSLCSVVMKKNIYKAWNNYIIDRYQTTLTTSTTYTTYTTLTTQLTTLFNKIHDSTITGRNLELFLPLFFIANILGEESLKETIKIAKDITESKKQEEEIESIDVMVYDFISRKDNDLTFHSVNDLTNEFKQFSNECDEWLNAKWFGRALKRLNLVVDKKRVGRGVEVMLNVVKAKEKLKIFK